MKLNNVIEFAKQSGFTNVEAPIEWNGYTVYNPICFEDADAYIGFPSVILEKDGALRMSTSEEAFAFNRYAYPEDYED